MKYLVLSDIHLGHNINKTENITNNLYKYFDMYKKDLKDLDMIFLAGDVFDRLLINSSNEYILSVQWILDLVLYCKKNNIMLRVLEGTPSHDWKQMKSISTILEKLNIELDYKYFDTLAIEHIDKFNIDILYVPDEYKHKASDTYQDVLKLLKKHKLTQVDIAIMHGHFRYQLPFELEAMHKEEDYLSIVKHYINIGHFHTHTIFERILGQGSFDRLKHNEEEAKGGMVMTIGDEDTYKFLVNTNSMIFKTIKFKQEPLKEIIKVLDTELKSIKPGSNIKILSEHESFLSKNIEDIKKRYPIFNIKYEKNKIKEKKKSIIDDKIVINSFSITPENITELMSEQMLKHNLNKSEIDIFYEELKKVI